MLIHYAETGTTACGVNIIGQLINAREYDAEDDEENVNHTMLTEQVNCNACKVMAVFMAAKKRESNT